MERYTYFDGGKWRLKIGDTEYLSLIHIFEKVLGKKAFQDAAGAHVVTPPGAPTLVPDTCLLYTSFLCKLFYINASVFQHRGVFLLYHMWFCYFLFSTLAF